MIPRPRLLSTMRAALRRSRAVALIGPRQCGKTTAARWILPPDSPNYFDLEDPASLARLAEPMTALQPLRGLARHWRRGGFPPTYLARTEADSVHWR